MFEAQPAAFFEKFKMSIHKAHPNRLYANARAVRPFFGWCDSRKLTIDDIEPTTVAAWVGELGRSHSAPSVKQHLAAIRMLFKDLPKVALVIDRERNVLLARERLAATVEACLTQLP